MIDAMLERTWGASPANCSEWSMCDATAAFTIFRVREVLSTEGDALNVLVALGLILVLATCGYAAGRLHAQVGYRVGYRFGYRQGYFDGDRASWHRRRRDLQAAVASVLKTPTGARPTAFPSARPMGTTYTSTAGQRDYAGGTGQLERPAGRDWVLLDASPGG
jgi:hypothetical protein